MAMTALSFQAAAGRWFRPLALAGLAALAGCADARPFEYTPGDEIPDGPGLLTGEAGAFVITIGGEPEADATEKAGEAGDISIGGEPEADTTEQADEVVGDGPD
jgi:hypothetical protein